MFLNKNKQDLSTCEFLIPTVVSELIEENKESSFDANGKRIGKRKYPQTKEEYAMYGLESDACIAAFEKCDQRLKDCYIEPVVKDAKAYDSFQFVRTGFFCVDSKDSAPDNLVFNRIVSLKSSFTLPKKD